MNILIVEDHPMVVEAYIDSLSKVMVPESVKFSVAYDFKQGYDNLFASNNPNFDLAIIDHRLPPFTEKNILSGFDFAAQVRRHRPECKIIYITAHTDVVTIYGIYKKIHPDALLTKNDVSLSVFPKIVSNTFLGHSYISPTAQKCIKDIWLKDLMIEECNRQILYYLSKGYRVKDLVNVIHLAPSTIQRRVVNMKRAFDATDDNGLVREAMRQGFI